MTEQKRNYIAYGLLAVGLLFIAIGVFRGEAEVVLRQAVNICLECIGIGKNKAMGNQTSARMRAVRHNGSQ